MTFAWPQVFPVFILLAVLLFIQWRTRGRDAYPFSSLDAAAASGRTWRQRFHWLPPVLQTLALSVLIFALARPQQDVVEARDMREGIAIEMLLDVSSSMDMSTDYEGKSVTRLEAAKKVLEDFVAGDGDTLKGREDDLIGIVTFARYADTICPLTLSRDAVVYLTREIEIQDRPNEDGTAYGDATALAAAHLKMFEQLQAESRRSDAEMPEIKSKIIVLLTDGENNCGNHLPLQAAAMAREWGIRIYTISFGEAPRMKKVNTDLGEVELPETMSATERILREMAVSTGGIFRQASDFDSLRAVYAEIDRLEKSELKPVKYKEKRELFHLFAFLALGFISTDVLLRSTVLRVFP
ncbi:MAG: VWA domain-containing protein [Verrucomicrobiota bacterium]